jgi:hypothetical protein
MTNGVAEADNQASTRTPSGWGQDDLSAFLEAARANQFATFARKPERYRRLAAIDELFVRVAKQWTNPKDAIAALLFLRCHSAFRAACGLAISGQIVEATAMHRACLETAAYALHINRNPGLGLVWLDRHQDEASLKRVRKDFKVERVRATIATCNRHAAGRFDKLYQRAEAALKTTAECGMVALEILQCVFGALFEILGVNATMLDLRKQL